MILRFLFSLTLLMSLVYSVARADEATITITGTVLSPEFFDNTVAEGTPYTQTFTFDTSTPGVPGSFGPTTNYIDPTGTWTMTFGDYLYTGTGVGVYVTSGTLPPMGPGAPVQEEEIDINANPFTPYQSNFFVEQLNSPTIAPTQELKWAYLDTQAEFAGNPGGSYFEDDTINHGGEVANLELNGGTFSAAVVPTPEPSTNALIVIGLLGLAGARAHQRLASQAAR